MWLPFHKSGNKKARFPWRDRLNFENKFPPPIFDESLFLTNVTTLHRLKKILLGTKEVGRKHWWKMWYSYHQAIVGDFNTSTELIYVLILMQIQRTKNQFPRLMTKFIKIGKLTKKDEPAPRSLLINSVIGYLAS